MSPTKAGKPTGLVAEHVMEKSLRVIAASTALSAAMTVGDLPEGLLAQLKADWLTAVERSA